MPARMTVRLTPHFETKTARNTVSQLRHIAQIKQMLAQGFVSRTFLRKKTFQVHDREGMEMSSSG
jgi:hypothetical protein